jgi:predicted ArsR family transcriptional regulator
MVEVTWTVDAGEEDLQVLKKHGSQALRRVRILRLVEEALDQGGAATQEDLAKALGVTARTIRGDIADLEAEGYRIATRGKLRGVGRGQTHQAIVLRLYEEGKAPPDIAPTTEHSVEAVDRYSKDYERVEVLLGQGLTVREISLAIDRGESTVLQ